MMVVDETNKQRKNDVCKWIKLQDRINLRMMVVDERNKQEYGQQHRH